MIEVEKKFLLEGDDETRLTQGADFVGEKVFTDIYYDTKDFLLTKQDKWLRNRGGKFELKLSLSLSSGKKLGIHEEVEDEQEIRKILGFSQSGSMEDSLQKNGYAAFCTCKTTRKKYKKGIFNIDIDFVEYGDFDYEVAEIEIMVENQSEVQDATDKIIGFAKERGLEVKYIRGKVIEFLKRKKPEHFRALIDAGVVRES